MKNDLTKRILSIVLVVMTVLSIAVSAMAANYCSNISGDSKSKVTFTVETGYRFGASFKLRFRQEKGTWACVTNWFDGLNRSTKELYASHSIYVTDMKTGKTTLYTWYGQDYTLKLSKNRTYKITVYPAGQPRGRAVADLLDNPSWWGNSTAGKNIKYCG